MHIIIKIIKNKENFIFVSLYNITLFRCIIIFLSVQILVSIEMRPFHPPPDIYAGSSFLKSSFINSPCCK